MVCCATETATLSVKETIEALERNGYHFAPRKGGRKYFDYQAPGPIVGRDSELLRLLLRNEAQVHDCLIKRAKYYLTICRIAVEGA